MAIRLGFIFLCCTVLSVVRTQKSLGCDEGWIPSNGNCYLIDNTRLITWNEALNECNRHDASVIFFESTDEISWYKQQLATYPSSAYWTSMNDIVSERAAAPGNGHWKWGLYDFVHMSYITWSASPGNDGKALCGGINLNGNMYDAYCNSKQGYICNIDGAAAQGGCPFGWLPTDTDCYYVSNTTDPSQLMTWQQAKQKCVALNANAHLITIDDVNDQKSMFYLVDDAELLIESSWGRIKRSDVYLTFVQGHLPYLSVTTYLHWTGLQGTGQPGGWKWFNGATFNQQLFTWATEPDNVAGIENCAVIRYNGKFSDRGCNMKQNYICKKQQLYTDTTFNLGCGLWTRANRMCYVFYTSPLATWTQAKQTCQSMRGDLINIKDIDTKAWLQEQLLDPANDASPVYWTALNDRQTEGTFKWGDGTILDANTINWNSEPNNWRGNEDCAVIMPSGQFNDVGCEVHAAPLCELDGVQSCPASGTWISMQTGTGVNCYLFGNYKNRTALKTNQEASDYCTSLAIDKSLPSGQTQSLIPKLYSVDSAAERDFIKKQLLNYVDNVNNFWTSLNDAQTEGFWTFGSNILSDTSFVEWSQQPSSLTPDTDCVYVGYNGNTGVRKCGLKMGYICERQAYLPWTSGAGTTTRNVHALIVGIVVSISVLVIH